MRAVVFAGLIVAMCGQCFAQAAPKVDERRLRVAFEEKLKDAESARFRDIKHASHETAGLWFVCGQVNAKNSFGAYEGFQPFYGMALKVGQDPIKYDIFAIGNHAERGCREKQLR